MDNRKELYKSGLAIHVLLIYLSLDNKRNHIVN